MGVTRPYHGGWLTNYGLNLLIISYLQQLKEPILPSLELINQLKRAKFEDHGLPFITDIHQLNFKTENKQTMSDLITGFFEYYDKFDYHKYAICAERGTIVEKKDNATFDIINILAGDNVAGNMNRNYFRALRKALHVSHSLEFNLNNECKSTTEDWGLVKLFRSCESNMFAFGKSKKKNPANVNC